LGITYHFLINTDGAIYWTQPLEAVVPTSRADVNADSIAVALGGNFMAAVPADAQMASAAHLIAWLLSTTNGTQAPAIASACWRMCRRG
jgi:hypothetical protein